MKEYVLVGRSSSYPYWSLFNQSLNYLILSLLCVFIGISVGLSGFNPNKIVDTVMSLVATFQKPLVLMMVISCLVYVFSTIGLLCTAGDLREEI